MAICFRLFALLVGLIFCACAWTSSDQADAPQEKEPGQPGTGIPKFRGPDFSLASLKTQQKEALGLLKRLKPDRIDRADPKAPSLTVTADTVAAIHFLKGCRSSDAIPYLIPFLEVRFIYADESLVNPQIHVELTADETLKAIGLPAVDQILKLISEGKLDKAKHPPARALCLDILGEDGLKARAGFLKLAKDEKVQKFLSGK